MPKPETLALLAIPDLCKYNGQQVHFVIPEYQRGYRWTPKEVERLLSDLKDFSQDDTRGKSFYCLQPICVAPGDNDHSWIVVDGQQRLTTIYLILRYCSKRLNYPVDIFSIEYITRESIHEEFLPQLDYNQTPEAVSENCPEAVERFYLQQAYCTIHEWFDQGKDDLLNFFSIFNSKKEKQKSVRVIWYDTQERGNADNIALFNRLNDGKIPLTNAELIRALFFNNQDDERQFIMADRWAAIENSLEDDEFWYFIYNEKIQGKHYSTRIEYIFDLYLGKTFDQCVDYDCYETFYDFRDKSKGNLKGTWDEVVGVFEKLREWFANRECFHRIGFLIQTGMPMLDILELSMDRKKKEFSCEIKNRIKSLFPSDRRLSDYSYQTSNDHAAIRNILLLFNIESILQNPKSCIRFSFANYNISWDIEHIRSVASEPPALNCAKSWYRNILPYFLNRDFTPDEFDNDSEQIQDEINAMDDPETRSLVKRIFDCANGVNLQQNSDKLFNAIIQHCGESGLPRRDDLGNLALLDSNTNRSYKNAPFPIKRKRITDNTKNGVFTPLCTLNVFLKFYSKKSTDSLLWGEQDAEQYFDAMKELLKDYFPAATTESDKDNQGD